MDGNRKTKVGTSGMREDLEGQVGNLWQNVSLSQGEEGGSRSPRTCQVDRRWGETRLTHEYDIKSASSFLVSIERLKPIDGGRVIELQFTHISYKKFHIDLRTLANKPIILVPKTLI